MQSMGYVATILFIAFNFKIYIVPLHKMNKKQVSALKQFTISEEKDM